MSYGVELYTTLARRLHDAPAEWYDLIADFLDIVWYQLTADEQTAIEDDDTLTERPKEHKE